MHSSRGAGLFVTAPRLSISISPLDYSKGNLVDSSPFTARLNMQNADVSEILALAKFDYPVKGTMNVSIQASGTKAEPRGDGHIQLTNGSIYGEPVERFNSELRFDRGQVELRNIQLTHYDSHVTGDANYNLSSRAFHFNLAGTNFDLTRIPQIQNRGMTVEGRMDFTAVGSGTPDAPAMNAIIRLRDLTFDHERAGDFTINAVTQGADLHLTGQSQFEHAELSIDGNVHLRGDWPSTVNLHFNQLDIDALLRTYLKGRVTGHSSVAGDLRLQGPLRMPRELNIVGNLSNFYADVENIKIHNDGPVRFGLSSQLLRIEEFRFTGEGTDLLASGTVQLSGERQLDFRAQGRVNLKLIESFNPDFTSSGVVTVDVTVSGTVAHPATQGRLQVANGSVAYSDLPSALNEINGSLVFNQDRLQIETLTARTGGGLLTFGGYASSYNRQIEFNLTRARAGRTLALSARGQFHGQRRLAFCGHSSCFHLVGRHHGYQTGHDARLRLCCLSSAKRADFHIAADQSSAESNPAGRPHHDNPGIADANRDSPPLW